MSASPRVDEPGDWDAPAFTPDEMAAWAARAPVGTGILTPVGVIDPEALSQAGRVNALIATERLLAFAAAQQQRIMAALIAHAAESADVIDPEGKQWVREDIACALRLAPGTARARMQTATDLVHRLPDTLAMLESGAISMRHADTLVDSCLGLDDPTATHVEQRVLARAPKQTVPNFRRSVNRAVLAADPRTAEHKHELERSDRRVWLVPQPHGMTELHAYLPAEDAQTIWTAIHALADRAPGSPAAGQPQDQRSTDQRSADQRSADQRRADALVALALPAITGRGTSGTSGFGLALQHGRRPTINVTVAASTLLGLDQQLAELDGYGPITAAHAIAIAHDPTATWRRLLTDPAGRLLEYQQRTYRPPQRLIDHVTARDPHCRFTGCTRTAHRCEIDHLHPHADGGSTHAGNLIPLCPRHHHLKHDGGWQVHGDPSGTLIWTSPTGHQYDSPPSDLPTGMACPQHTNPQREDITEPRL